MEIVKTGEDYEYQVRVYERNRKIYEDSMHRWEAFNETASRMDARFDKALFTVAAGSFALSFAFTGNVVPLKGAACLPLLVASWACFAACLVVMALGHLLSSIAYLKQRDELAARMARQLAGENSGEDTGKSGIGDMVSPCNYVSLFLCTGGIVCLLLFVLLNLVNTM
jgi:hypothetical protein